MKNNTFKEKFRNFCQNRFGKIIEINEKYAHPKIEMSRTVTVSLFLLRAYLIFLLLLLGYKFTQVARHKMPHYLEYISVPQININKNRK